MEPADLASLPLRTDDERRALRQVAMLEGPAQLWRELSRAPSSESAIRIATRFVGERLEVPAAGWCESPDGSLAHVAQAGHGDQNPRTIPPRFGAQKPPHTHNPHPTHPAPNHPPTQYALG